MSKWDEIREEIHQRGLFEDISESEWNRAIEILKYAAQKNLIPFGDINEQGWNELRKKVLFASTNAENQRKGDRRGQCPFQGMNDRKWRELCEIMKDSKLRGQDRRKSDRRTQ